MKAGRIWLAVIVGLSVQATGLLAQGSSPLSQAIRSYQNLDYETASDLLRRVVRAGNLPADQQDEALSYLAASEFYLGHRDAALTAFRQLVALDVRNRPDPLIFPPEVQQVFDEARRGLGSLQVSVPPDTELRVGRSRLPIRLYTSTYQDVAVGLANRSGDVIHWIYTGPITDSVDLAWDGRDAAHNVFSSGSYRMRVVSRGSNGRATRTVDIPLQVELIGQDTLPVPLPPEKSLYLPERSRAGLINTAAKGLALGVAVLALPALAGVDSVSTGAPLLVGSAIGLSGVIGLLLQPGGREIDGNVAYNRRLRETWREKVDSATQENARRRADVRLRVRAGQPTTREGSD